MAVVTVIPPLAQKVKAKQTAEEKKIKVAAYCRVSTDSDEQAGSYEEQVRHYIDYINSNPKWALAGIYADDGISGTDTRKREEFNRMIADCRDGKIQMILTKSISRFARNTIDCIQNIRDLKALGIAVFFEKENINTMDRKGELLITIMASIAQQESQSISQNVKMGIQFRYQEGKVMVNHNRFLGYTKDADGQLVVEPKEAEVVKRIYQEYLEGRSLQEICNGLMADGILTGAGKKKWVPSTVQIILSNEKYMGDALLQKTVTTDFLKKTRTVNVGHAPQYYVEGSQEAIISKDVYHRVQKEMERRANLRSGTDGKKKRIYSSKYALSRLCTCEKCGDIYRRVAWNNRGKRSVVWRCCTRVEQGPEACDAVTIQEEELKHNVLKAINLMLERKNSVIADLKKMLKHNDSDALMTRIHDLDDRNEEIQKEIASKAKQDEAYGELAEEIQRIRIERQKLLVESAEEKGKNEQTHCLIHFLEEQQSALEEYDEQLVRKLIEKIIIHSDGNITVIFKGGSQIKLEE